MTPYELRPLAIGELLDRVFSLYRRHLSTFVGIMAIPAIFNLMLALAALYTQQMRRPLLDPRARFDSPEVMQMIYQIAGIYFLAIFVYWVTYMLALGAATVAVAEIYAGRDIGIGGAFARARQQLGRLLYLAILWMIAILGPGLLFVALGAGFLIGFRQSGSGLAAGIAILLMFLGLLVLVVTSLWLSLRYAVSAPALVLEGVSAPTALRRSAFLTQGFLGRVFLLTFCAAMLAYTALMLFQMPFNVAAVLAGPTSQAGFWLSMTGAISGTIGQTLTAPIMVIGVSVLYYDFRVRKEALDLQVMMSALDSQDGGLSMTPPPSPALPN